MNMKKVFLGISAAALLSGAALAADGFDPLIAALVLVPKKNHTVEVDATRDALQDIDDGLKSLKRLQNEPATERSIAA